MLKDTGKPGFIDGKNIAEIIFGIRRKKLMDTIRGNNNQRIGRKRKKPASDECLRKLGQTEINFRCVMNMRWDKFRRGMSTVSN